MSARVFKGDEILPRMTCTVRQGNLAYRGVVVKADPLVVVVSIVHNGKVLEGPVKRTEVAAAWWENQR